MKDERKTRAQLISELAELHRRVAELEVSIMDHKRAEEVLQSSDTQYRTTLDSMGDAIHVVDIDLRLILFNKTFERWNKELGLETEVLGQNVFEVFPFLSDGVRDEYDWVFKNRKILTTEESNVVAGKKIITETRKIPICVDDKVSWIVTVIRDITDRKKADEALRESEEKYRLVVENANEGIIVTQDGRIRLSNPRASHFTGYSMDELTSRPFPDFVHPDDHEMVMQHHLSRLRGEETPEAYVFRLINKNGGIRWIEIRGVRISWEDRPASLSFLRDITERKLVEEALRQRVEEMTALNTFGQQVGSSLSLVRVVEAALEGIFAAVAPDLALLFVLEGDKLILQGAHLENSKSAFKAPGVHRVGECLCGLAVSEGKAVYSRKMRSDHRCTLPECKEAGLLSFASLPLRSGDKIIGVLGLASREERDFEKQANFLESLSSQVAIALQNAALYEEVQRYSTKLEKNILERKKVEQTLREREVELKEQSTHLEEVNAALKVLLKRREEDRIELAESVQVNVGELILPYLEKLQKSQMQPHQTTLTRILELHLKDIVSPFTAKLSSRFIKLTPTEIKLANLIKDGRTNKEFCLTSHIPHPTSHISDLRSQY